VLADCRQIGKARRCRRRSKEITAKELTDFMCSGGEKKKEIMG